MNLNLRTEPGVETTAPCDLAACRLDRDVGDISATDIYSVTAKQPVEAVGHRIGTGGR